MKTIYVCPPTWFDVNYSINPWMEGNFHQVNHAAKYEQWNALVEALREAGAQVGIVGDPPQNCPDAVFIANAGLLFRGHFIPSRFRHEERVPEEPFFRDLFSKFRLREFIPASSREQLSFEGAGDALYDKFKNIMWMGFGFRTSLSYKPMLELTLEEIQPEDTPTVRPLELVDPRFYHLDTCFCPLDTGQLLWFPEAFSDHSRYVIDLWYGNAGVPLPYDDALRFGCNAVSIGNKVILPKLTDYGTKFLEAEGLQLTQVDMSQYLRSGGACKCLTLEAIE